MCAGGAGGGGAGVPTTSDHNAHVAKRATPTRHPLLYAQQWDARCLHRAGMASCTKSTEPGSASVLQTHPRRPYIHTPYLAKNSSDFLGVQQVGVQAQQLPGQVLDANLQHGMHMRVCVSGRGGRGPCRGRMSGCSPRGAAVHAGHQEREPSCRRATVAQHTHSRSTHLHWLQGLLHERELRAVGLELAFGLGQLPLPRREHAVGGAALLRQHALQQRLRVLQAQSRGGDGGGVSGGRAHVDKSDGEWGGRGGEVGGWRGVDRGVRGAPRVAAQRQISAPPPPLTEPLYTRGRREQAQAPTYLKLALQEGNLFLFRVTLLHQLPPNLVLLRVERRRVCVGGRGEGGGGGEGGAWPGMQLNEPATCRGRWPR
jgi:hypothetical protein